MRWILVLALLWASVAAQAQGAPVTVEARLSQAEMHVGDVISYELRAQAPTDYSVEVPPMPDTSFGEWEVRECGPLTEQPTAGQALHGWTCQLTVWEIGTRPLPTQIVRYTAPDGTAGSTPTQPISMVITSVLPPDATDIMPIKAPLPMNEEANILLIIGISLLALLVLLFCAWAIWFYYRRRPRPAPAAPIVPPRNPVAIAMAELDRIAGLRLMEKQREEEHYALIADVLRQFIADRYSVPALERTTGEVRMALSRTAIQMQRDTLLELLNICDGVKFARRLPTIDEGHGMVEQARQAIRATL